MPTPFLVNSALRKLEEAERLVRSATADLATMPEFTPERESLVWLLANLSEAWHAVNRSTEALSIQK